MCQLPEFKQFPLYHPSMTFSQVIPKLSSRGRDLLQVILYTIVLNPNKYIPLNMIQGTQKLTLYLFWFQHLLICNPAHRLSADESMEHQYFQDLSPSIKNF